MSARSDADVLDYLREQFARVHTTLGLMRGDLRDLKVRMTSVEDGIAGLHGDFANQSRRLDRIETRLDRIERRLELESAVPGGSAA